LPHQDFLVGSARNVGARELERRAEGLASCLRSRAEAAHATRGGEVELEGDAEHGVVEQHVAARADAVVCGFEEVAAFWKVRQKT
jgi:hypothetical protein